MTELTNTEDKTLESTPEDKPTTVDVEHHNRVKSDMMKYKQEKNDLKTRLADLEAAAEQTKLTQMEANQEWEKVAGIKDKQLQELVNEQKSTKEAMVNSHKKAAVIQKVGGFVKSSYADFAINLENIAMIDGVIDDTTLDAECERIRKEEGSLLKKTFSSNLPSNAPDLGANAQTKDYNSMTTAEKDNYRRQLVLDRLK